MRPVPSTKMEPEVLKAISRLKNDSDFQVLAKYFEEASIVNLKRSAVPDEVASRWQQGAFRYLDELLDNIETCEEQLKVIELEVEASQKKKSIFAF